MWLSMPGNSSGTRGSSGSETGAAAAAGVRLRSWYDMAIVTATSRSHSRKRRFGQAERAALPKQLWSNGRERWRNVWVDLGRVERRASRQ